MTNQETSTTNAAVSEQALPVAPIPAPSKSGAKAKKVTSQGRKTANAPNPKTTTGKKAKSKKPAKAPSTQRQQHAKGESKGASILALIRRAKGATLQELMQQTGWQAHSVRGFLSIASRKHDLKMESSKNESGERVYSVPR